LTVTSIAIPAAQDRTARQAMVLHAAVGFFFGFRICLTFLFFQADPRLGTEVSMAISLLLWGTAFFYSFGDSRIAIFSPLKRPILRWVAAYLAWSALSLIWTAADSRLIAGAYWVTMAADVFTVILLFHRDAPEPCMAALMKGFIAGAIGIAVVAWCAPTLPDLRLGDAVFMHPNYLGLEFGIAVFLAQYLARENHAWYVVALILGVTLLRTISKTAIIAFIPAEIYYVFKDVHFSRTARIRVAIAACVAVACLWGLYERYLIAYAATGDAAETLTGRTEIWAVAIVMALEAPWIGHGIYSFRNLIPAFGTFEPWHAHNELLQQFFEYGAVGVLLTLGIYIEFFLRARQSLDVRYRAVSIALVIFTAIRGLADTINFGLSFPLWLFAALALAAPQLRSLPSRTGAKPS
jgi:exopolysaccharide production protein ExoQ